MSKIVGVLTCNIEGIDYSIVMDSIDDTSVTTTAEITDQPLISGDFVSDHLFKKPASVEISGVFGLGNNRGIVVNDGKLQLIEVQTLFEKIKNEGILCSFVKMRVNENSHDVRFLQRNNLALNSITWTEKIDTLGFDFSFQEIGFAKTIEYEVEMDDENMPNVQDLIERSFSETLFNTEDTMKAILQFMLDEGIMTTDFTKQLAGNRAEWFLGLGLGIFIGILAISAIGGLVGLLVGVIVVAVAVVVTFFVKLGKALKYKVKPFNKYNEKERNRWAQLMKEIMGEIGVLNEHIKCFQPTTDKDQECILSLDGTYFVFDFTTNNVNKTKTLELIDSNNQTIKSLPNLAQSSQRDYSQCTSKNGIYANKNTSTYMNIVYTGEDTEEEKSRFSNYIITISSIPPEEYVNKMAKIIENYLIK